ncbi:C39 family peptidase [Amphibacillus jilinensis]|uniref:C39 family peptidase n=1 Tax=Amphibacillus jilinensis TaxID=1216008 RepID=UPI000319CC88|nr:papain-like cysteine protease family protein [Amphibacillus jilinensis]
MEKRFSFYILIFLLIFFSFPDVVLGSSKSLSVKSFDQEKSQWCWVAAPQIIINYHKNSKPTQCTLVKRGKNTSSCANEPGTLNQTKKALTESGMSSGGKTTSSASSYNTIKSNINNSRPLILRKEWKENGKKNGVGHLSVIDGYNNTDNKIRTIRIRQSGTFKSWDKYADLKNSSEFAWTHTIYNIKK